MPEKNYELGLLTSDVGEFDSKSNHGNADQQPRSELGEIPIDVITPIAVNWINKHLDKVGGYVRDLYQDLKDGRNLIILLSSLSNEQIPRITSRMRIHMLKNIRGVLDFIERHRSGTTTTFHAQDIVDGDPTATLSLVVTIMLIFERPRSSRQNNDARPSLKDQLFELIGTLTEAGTIDQNRCRNEEDVNLIPQQRITESFWRERMNNFATLELTHENSSNSVKPVWKIGAWCHPVFNTIGDTRRMLLDAFMIYLARITSQTEFHIGWRILETRTERDEVKQHDFVVPMSITVSFDEPWSRVSEVIDIELATIARNSEIAYDLITAQDPHGIDSSATIESRWPIVVWSTEHETEAKRSTPRGRVLTLQIDERGRYRWIYDASKLTADLLEQTNKHVRKLVRDVLASSCEQTPINELDVSQNNELTLLLKKSGFAQKSSTQQFHNEVLIRPEYEAPRGDTEIMLARVWEELFNLEKVDRREAFFALGGNINLALQLIERICNLGFEITLYDIFRNSTLCDMARTVRDYQSVEVPVNVITRGVKMLTPKMLPLIDLTQTDIDHIISKVTGGIDNIQDIYALSPMQDGILFRHLMTTRGDPPMINFQLRFYDRQTLDRYILAMEKVLLRYDILRTAFFWETLSTPAQVVLRQVMIPVTEIDIVPNEGSTSDQLTRRYDPRSYRMNLQQAPLLQLAIGREFDGSWVLMQLQHQLISDDAMLETMHAETIILMRGQEQTLSVPKPLRDLIAHVRSSIDQEEQEVFFTDMLEDVDQPTLAFGLAEMCRNDLSITESQQCIPLELEGQVKYLAKTMNVSVAVFCHLSWALVLSRASGLEKLVFGTVLSERTGSSNASTRAMGLFINTLPISFVIDDTPVRNSIRRTHNSLARLLKYEHTSLALAQRCSSLRSDIPLFNSLLNCHYRSVRRKWNDTETGVEILDCGLRTNYPITLSFDDHDSNFVLTAQTTDPVSPDQVCALVIQALASLSESLNADSKLPIRGVEVLPEFERKLLLEIWNPDVIDQPVVHCLHQDFERKVALSPTATALIHNNEVCTYSDLNTRANQLAHRLIELGVGPDRLVGICVSVSLSMVVSVLAILKAGGAYVPLDTEYPQKRLIDIIIDASLDIIVVDEIGLDKLKNDIPHTWTPIHPDDASEYSKANPTVPELGTQNLSHVIFTSGTTGKPKGVMIEHQHVVRFFDSLMEHMYLTDTDAWGLFHSLSFDYSVLEIWGGFRSGGKLVLASREEVCSPNFVCQLICEHRITVLGQTPSAFKTMITRFLDKSIPDTLRYVILAGESLDATLLRPLYLKCTGPLPEFVNIYGPTEITIAATLQLVREEDTLTSASMIGRGMSHSRIYLLGNNLQQVPLGAVGEIYVGGTTVTRGFHNMPDLTRERYLDDPFRKTPGAKMYKTADLARYLPDGNLLYMGRNDQQVKIRGFRIEASEIQACLKRHHAVRDALVLTYGKDSDKRLVAYVEVSSCDDLAATLRSHVSSELPEYMVPSAIVQLDAFPMNRNGKVDMQALPAPSDSALIRKGYEAPKGEIETMLATIWENLLGVKNISRNDSFFAIGGHSLMVFKINEYVRSFGYELTMRKLFEQPILSELAKTIGVKSSVPIQANAIVPGVRELTPEMLPLIELTQSDIDHIIAQVPGGIDNIKDIYALSPLQDGILFHHLMTTECDPYIITVQLEFRDHYTLSLFISAFEKVILRHDIYRTAFFWENLSRPAQVVLREVQVSVTELDIVPNEGSALEQLNRLYNSHSYQMNLQKAPLIHFGIARETDGRWILIHLQHHLISDHTMLELMLTEMKAILRGQEQTLSNPVPFRNLIATVRASSSQGEHVQFFTEMLSDIIHPTLVFELAEVNQDGSSIVESHNYLPPDLNERVRHLARNMNASVAVFFHLSWALVVSRTSGNERLVFGTVLLERICNSQEAESASASFINTLPIRFDIDHTPVSISIRQMQQLLGRLLGHEHASLAVAQRCSGVANGTPLFNSLLNCRYNSPQEKFEGLDDGIRILRGVERTNYPVMFSVDDDGSSIGLKAQSIEPVNPDHICALMQQGLTSISESLMHNPNVPIHSIEVMPESERELLLDTLNVDEFMQPDLPFLHQYFEKQVELAPMATALIHDDEVCTYLELNIRANRLAHRLIELGVGPECLVGICVSVGFGMVVAVLAIQKAGGAFVPLDPAYPQQRLIDIVTDAALSIIIADEVGSHKLGTEMPIAWTAIHPDAPLSYPEINPTVQDLQLKNLAHIIYTSGSSGGPKSVMAEHRNVVRMFDATKSWSQFNQHDVWALVHSLTFDPSVWEIWGALRYGGQLVLMSRDVVLSPDDTYDLICKHRITVFNQTPTAFREILDRFIKKPIPQHLRCVILGGESFDPSILVPLYAAHNGVLPRFINIYGPTETTMWTTFKELRKPDTLQSSSPIGYRICDTKVYLLDAHRRPVPLGVVGELYIGGAGVARGYLKRPDLTADCFFADPFSNTIDSRMYKTGDLAQYRSDHSLVYIGRNDDQVKIRGFRVEPREIEACLSTHPSIEHAVVIPFGEQNDKILVAYVVSEMEDDFALTLREYVCARLPGYMVPSKFIRLDALPFTSNGKLNRKALPPPDSVVSVRRTYEALENSTECILASIWGQLLGMEMIGRRDDFFTLGGHSILALRMIGLAGKQGLHCTLNDLFQYPVLSDLVVKLMNGTSAHAGLAAVPIRTTGSELPIFFPPTANGDFSYVYSLSQHIRPSCPIYALPWPNIPDDKISTIADIARHSISLMKAVQPVGPYRLCGYSAAGHICLAMANLLRDSGEFINFLGLIDTLAFDLANKTFSWKRGVCAGFLQRYMEPERRDGILELLGKVDAMSLIEFVDVAKKMKFVPPEISSDTYVRELERRIAFSEILETSEPRDLDLIVHQFNASDRFVDISDLDQVIGSFTEQLKADWSQRLPKTTFQAIALPGDHETIVCEPENRLVLCQAINQTVLSAENNRFSNSKD